ncbi:ferritin-like domain-containing protein [Clostridium chromiireducens]|uniref:ferritin-like domain-containing protein n=1 Tax=Clostridium chromiireducens TaxID=225345 RepID=UPI001FA9527D|nr:ferritin-like domain-containing protein [Clostridium chromiireducens]
MEVPVGEEETFETPESYLDGIKKALFGELGAVEMYKAIRRRLPMGAYKDVLFDIITDELKHASKYNYLFTLNSTSNNSNMNENLMKQKINTITDTTNNEGSSVTNAASTKNTANFIIYVCKFINKRLRVNYAKSFVYY